MYIHVFIHVCIRTQVLMKPARLSSKPVFDFARLFALLSIAASVASLPQRPHTHTYIYVYLWRYRYVHILCMYVCMCVCIGRGLRQRVCAYIYIYIYTYTYTHNNLPLRAKRGEKILYIITRGRNIILGR